MWCKAGKQELAGRVPIFVTLKEFADDRRKPETLLKFVLDSYGFTDSATTDLEELLKAGRALILLDGLDEVQNSEHDRVLSAIREFGRRYGPKGQSLEDEQAQADQNQIVITCRIAAREYIFERFSEVEVADFRDEQIQDFANKWFLAHAPDKRDKDGASTVGQLFWQELEHNQPVKELATNPLLLTLLCLEFGEDCGFPSSRAELYERGLDILFTKWDGTRQIKRYQVYKKLPVMRKKALLAQLAWTMFERGDYFFKQAVAERKIQQYIQNLPGASEDEEVLLLDSNAVLNSIEAQHGLLTQRAVGIYSFSHLTFQEYFSAAHLARQSALQAELIERMHETQWREVFLLTTEKLEDSENFLLMMKQKNDFLIERDEKVKTFFRTHCLKEKWDGNDDKTYEIRAFWGSHALNRARSHKRIIAYTRARNLARDLASEDTLDRTRKFNLFHLTRIPERSISIAYDLGRAHKRTYAFALLLDLALDLDLDLGPDFDIELDFNEIPKIAMARVAKNDFKQKLELLYQEMQPIQALGIRSNASWQWWEKNGQQWAEQLHQALINYRNIGHDWQFTIEEVELLENYYYGSKLIIDCLNSECYVSREVRQQIEDTLLVPPD